MGLKSAWIGLKEGALVELAAYDDRGAQQGRMVAQLKTKGEAGPRDEGQVWLAQALAFDPYFDYWFGETCKDLHACAKQAGRCGVQTLYRNPLHMDVFRILPGRSAMGLVWLSDDEKKKVERSSLRN